MKNGIGTTKARPKKSGEWANRALLGALACMLLVTTAHAEHAAPGIGGTWHVAVPGWGIEDHLLVIEESHGRVTGKFEFATVDGSIAGTDVRLDVKDENGRIALHFDGTVSGDRMKGQVTSPKDGPLVQHGVANPLTTKWTAAREEHAG